jgi:uncharacterized protein involved in exopolysaccharide biosynthesis
MDKTQPQPAEGLMLIRFLYRWRKLLITGLVLAIIASLVVTLLMEPKYTSSGIIFPTPTNSPQKILDEPQFGYEVDADWLMQVLKSDIVKDTLVNLFNLADYFNIDQDEPGWRDDLSRKYNEMLSFDRTRYMSIEISATTSDPNLSANIVNAIIDRIDGIREKIFKANTYRSMVHLEEAFMEKSKLVNSLMDSIHAIRDKNTSSSLNKLYSQIKEKQEEVTALSEELTGMRNEHDFYDLSSYISILNSKLTDAKSVFAQESGRYEVLSENLSKGDTSLVNTKARMEGANRNIAQFESKLDELNSIKKRYAEVQAKLASDLKQLNQLKEQYENTSNAFEPYVNSIMLERLASDYTHEQVLLNELRYNYENAVLNYENPIPSVYVIDRAEPSFERSSPSLLINSVIIISATLALMIGVLLLWEKMKEIRSALHE